jgi:VWFA-related protein
MKWLVCPRLAPVRQGFTILTLLLLMTLSPQSPSQSPSPDSATSSAAQQPAGASGTLRVTTRMVMVDVVAVDKKGQPVKDLEASDFSLREDGREQAISTFNFQNPAAQGAANAPARDSGPPPANMFRNLPRYQSSGALNVILIDALNSTLPHQAYVRDEMVHFLQRLPQGQPIAIYALGSKLRLLQDFTTDLSELKNVISAFKGQKSHLIAKASGNPETPAVQGVAAQVLATLAPQLMKQIENFTQESLSEQTGMRVQLTLSALNMLARTLAGYPGRKNLIWISESIPMMIVPDIHKISRENRDFSDQLAITANLLTDAQIAVYPIDARGLVTSSFYDPANNVGGQAAIGGAVARSEGALAEELLNAHSSMEDLAAKTGGKAYFNHNDIAAAVRGDIEDGGTYYSLGYYPANKDWSGQFRKIQIASKRPGIKLRYRQGYFAVDRAEYMKRHPQQRDLELDLALNPDSPEATALQFQATVAPSLPQSGNHLLVNFAIDPQQIGFARGDDGLEHASVECAVRVFAARNVEAPIKSLGARAEPALEPEVYERISHTFFPCHVTLDLEPGDYVLRLAVRDNATGHVGAVNGRVTVPLTASPD